MDVLNRILELIASKFPSDAAFEDALNIKRKTVDSWKRNNSKSYLNKIVEISQYFHVSTDYLLTGKKSDNIKVYDEEDNLVVLDDETREIIDNLRKRPDMKMLFSVSKKATPEDIIQTVKIIEALKGNKEGD